MDFLETSFASFAKGLAFVLFIGLLILVLVLLTRRYVRAIGLTAGSKLRETRHTRNKISSQVLPTSATTTTFQLTPLYTTPSSSRRRSAYLSPRLKSPSFVTSSDSSIIAAEAVKEHSKRTDFTLPARLPFFTPVKIKPVESSPLAQRRRAASESPQR